MQSDRGKQIALLLQAVIDIDREKKEWLLEWKDRRERLTNELNILRANILSGQMEIEVPLLREDEHAAAAGH